MAFQFKRFSVDDSHSTMKVGTDAVLLGAWANIKNAKRVLDIGTGCGIIAMMIAQRSNAHIDAIDIDGDSVKQAEANFKNCRWSERLRVLNRSLEDFTRENDKYYDLIVSNPPYFMNALPPEEGRKRIARHTSVSSAEHFIKDVLLLLHPAGQLCIISPMKESRLLRNIATDLGLSVQHTTEVIAREGKEPNLCLLAFGLRKSETINSKIIILDTEGQYTMEYRELTREFYLDF